MVRGDAVGDVLQQYGFPGPRRGDDQPPLPLADRREHIHDARRKVLRIELQIQLLIGVEGGQVVKKDLVAGRLGAFEVDLIHLEKGEILLPLLRGADLAGNGIPRPQAEPPDLRRGDVDVVRTGEVVVIHGTEESEAVGQDFQHAGAGDNAVFLRLRLQNRENQVLTAHAAGARYLQFLGQLCQLTDRLPLDVFDVHVRILNDVR